MMMAHYFDDSILLELSCLASVAKTMLIKLFGYFGAL